MGFNGREFMPLRDIYRMIGQVDLEIHSGPWLSSEPGGSGRSREEVAGGIKALTTRS